ncbi:aminotransferase-like domain-containing protein [Acanthopleuribacter pedis]|uniref:PLP-dependent aminotransferase family protein n=1 Tax=Acanthopleuribacter pedis TaxID=442870 RepID=A0A8J7QEF8_9BACT|nr:PLP-dependent aminotransferase family protein [Acanthopleuribacter pedis]MBO1322734.1 PLP-dependent aminotransferase family protein [Acanthopleuribacter pedis]
MEIPALNREHGDSLTDQIVHGLRRQIQDGVLEPGSRLPSIRGLARQVAVSPMTVVKAYESLETDGWISREHGRGTFVKGRDAVAATRGDTDWQLALIDGLPRVSELPFNPTANVDVKINLANAVIGEGFLPTAALSKLLYRFSRDPDAVLSTYSNTAGEPVLVRAASDLLGIDEKELIITSGAQQATYIAARSFVGPDQAIAVEAPTYMGAVECFKTMGRRVLQIPVDEEGMRTDLLAAACEEYPIRMVYTVPAFQNPTGAVMSARRRAQLLEVAENHRLVVLEDDIWGDLYFEKPPPTSLYKMDQGGHVIYIKSFSKIVSPGCRIAAVALRGHFHKRFLAHKSAMDLGTPVLTQAVVGRFLESGQLPGAVEQLRVRLHKLYQSCVDTLEREAPDGMVWFPVQGGLTIWIKLPDGVRANETVRELSYKGIHVLSGDLCYMNEVLDQHVRITFCYPDTKRLIHGVSQLCETVKRLSERGRPARRRPTL